MEAVNIIFDGPPSHESGRFVEVETDEGRSIKIGKWIEAPTGYWSLRIKAQDILDKTDGKEVTTNGKEAD